MSLAWGVLHDWWNRRRVARGCSAGPPSARHGMRGLGIDEKSPDTLVPPLNPAPSLRPYDALLPNARLGALVS